MCGIAGWLGPMPGAGDVLAPALAVLTARGPDGVARLDGRIGAEPLALGVRRLELVDPAPASEGQPVHRPDGARLVFNGEIYNHAELRRGLEDQGEVFSTGGDAEVLAALLVREGVTGLRHVRGSYAFAFVGPEADALWLGRDPLGVRPLCYARLPQALVFASTVDAVLATGAVARRADLDAIADVLRDGVVSSERTAIHGVERVAPGTVLRIDERLRVTTHAVPGPSPEAGGDLDVLDALRVAVHDRMASHRPTTLFLSGGVDSALLAALASENGPVTAYTMTFPGHGGIDESARARRTARRLGLTHQEVTCPRDPSSWVLSTAAAFDEPFADASAVPTWGLALAASRRARITLTGTGGDEVFGGYRRYWLLGAGPWLRHVPAFVREPVGAVLERGLPDGARVLRAAGDPEGLYRGLLRLQPLGNLRALLGPLLEGAADPRPRPPIRSPGEAMAEDLRVYLPNDLLVKEDRALSAHGMEGRHPFLDERVRRAALHVDHDGGPGRGRQKRLLRAYVQAVVDPDIARAPKHGFAFPVDALYRGPLRPLAEDVLMSRASMERGFLTPVGVRRLLRHHGQGERRLGSVLHALVMLELWARRVLDGVPRRALYLAR